MRIKHHAGGVHSHCVYVTQVKAEFPGILIIDYTLPMAVNGEQNGS